MKRIIAISLLFIALCTNAAVVKVNNSYKAYVTFDDATISTDIVCHINNISSPADLLNEIKSYSQDISIFFNSDKKAFKERVCTVKKDSFFFDEKNFRLSDISLDLVFQNYDLVLNKRFNKTVTLNDNEIDSKYFKIDFQDYMINEPNNLPVLVNQGPIKNKIYKNFFKIEKLYFDVEIERDGYILDTFFNRHNTAINSIKKISISSLEEELEVSGFYINPKIKKITNSYTYGMFKCINGIGYYNIPGSLKKTNWICNDLSTKIRTQQTAFN